MEWTQESSDKGSTIDRIVIKRKLQATIGREGRSITSVASEQNLQLKFYFDNNPKKFKLHKSLAEILGIEEDTRVNIIGALWQYIKSNRLQESDNREVINCNAELIELFELEKITFNEIIDQLKGFLEEADPMVIDYKIEQNE